MADERCLDSELLMEGSPPYARIAHSEDESQRDEVAEEPRDSRRPAFGAWRLPLKAAVVVACVGLLVYCGRPVHPTSFPRAIFRRNAQGIFQEKDAMLKEPSPRTAEIDAYGVYSDGDGTYDTAGGTYDADYGQDAVAVRTAAAQDAQDRPAESATLGYYNEPLDESTFGREERVDQLMDARYAPSDTFSSGSGQASAQYVDSKANRLGWNTGMSAWYTTLSSTTTTTMRPDSLFCFALAMPSGYEQGLLAELLARGASIFSCDDYQVFSETEIEIVATTGVRIVATAMGSMHCEYGGPYHLALNTDVFVKAWNLIFVEGRFSLYAWTVKVDPDCVFLPQLLRKQVLGSDPGADVYLNNCDQGLHGPIEVISVGGMLAFKAGIQECLADGKLIEEKSTGGEDVFLRHCLGKLDINRVDDFNLLSEKACFWEDPTTKGCTSGKVSFHPFKKSEDYFRCLDQALQTTPKVDGIATSTSTAAPPATTAAAAEGAMDAFGDA